MTAADPALEPTPTQWVDQFLGMSRPEQDAAAARILAQWRTAMNCFLHNHDNRIRDLEQQIIRTSRATPPRDEVVERITLRDHLEAVDRDLATGIDRVLATLTDRDDPYAVTSSDGRPLVLDALAARGQVLAALAQLRR